MPARIKALALSRPRRITRLAQSLMQRAKRQGKAVARPFCRRVRSPRPKRMIAYDLETTPIKAGTPQPLYLTAYGEGFCVSEPLQSIDELRSILVSRFLTQENIGARFVAWNGNKFDCFFIGAALLHAPEFELRPYLTRNKSLRGIRVSRRAENSGEDKTQATASAVPGKPLGDKPKAPSWEFLDGISMVLGTLPDTGDKSLRKFLKAFAPDYQKLEGPNFETEAFNPKNQAHVKYAQRDSEGLFHGLQMAESIVREHFGQGLQPTIGNLGIRVLQAHLPADVRVWAPSFAVEQIVRRHVMRGGYCFASRHYCGPVWKYDINQAYAAAMRDARLPQGRCIGPAKILNQYAQCSILRVTARNRANKIPFYVRDADGKAYFAIAEIADSWITSSEYDQLKAEKWSIVVHESYYWEGGFNLKEYVDKLEALRMSDPEGPNGSQGTMMKSLGNNSYGKTVEQLDGLELIMSMERPTEEFFRYQDETDVLQHIWARIGKPQPREYHQPQLGAFITAHVRMVVRRAILQAPDAWLYSDTDCCMFDRAVPSLPIDAKRYGLWKIETDGEAYRLITKKVYASYARDCDDPSRPKDGKAKGLNVKRLSMEDFEAWYQGRPPTQTQAQRQNFLAVMTGAEMFVERVKVGQRMAAT